MSDSLQLLAKCFIVFFLIVSLSSALQIGVSPGEVKIKGEVNERLCIELEVYSKDYNGFLIVEDRWSDENGRNLSVYNKTAGDFDMDVIYIESLEALSKQNHDVCFIAHNEGKYNGLIIYETEFSGAGVGSWITLDTKKSFFDENLDRIQLTGSIVRDLAGESPLLAQVMLFIFLILVLILSLFLRRGALKRNRQ